MGGFRSFVGVRANEQSAPEAVNRCVDGKRESSPESQAGRSNGLAVLTGEHLAALALRDGAQRIQIAFRVAARLLESPRPYLAAFYRHDLSCRAIQQRT